VSISAISEGTHTEATQVAPFVPHALRIKSFMLWFTDGMEGTIFMTIITVWALFGDDIRLVATYKEADDLFTVLTILTFAFFLIELCAYLSTLNPLNLPLTNPVLWAVFLLYCTPPEETIPVRVTRKSTMFTLVKANTCNGTDRSICLKCSPFRVFGSPYISYPRVVYDEHNDKHAYAGQSNSFMRLRALFGTAQPRHLCTCIRVK
jgi:hypothetical protein